MVFVPTCTDGPACGPVRSGPRQAHVCWSYMGLRPEYLRETRLVGGPEEDWRPGE